MKVIEQLCDYLLARGMLSGEDQQRLRDRGFCRPNEYEKWDDPVEWWEWFEPPEEDWWSFQQGIDEQNLYEQLERRDQPRGGKGNRKGPRQRIRKAEVSQLTAALNRRLPEHESLLSLLVVLGHPLDSVTTWQQAASVIMQTDTERLSAILSDALERGEMAVSRCIDLTLFEPFSANAVPPILRRPLLALANGAADEYPPARRMLRDGTILDTYHLVLAQRSIVRALGQVAVASPHLLVRSRLPSVFHCRFVLLFLAAAILAQRSEHILNLGDQFIYETELARIELRFWSGNVNLSAEELRALTMTLAAFELSASVLGELLEHGELPALRTEVPSVLQAALVPLIIRSKSGRLDGRFP